MRILLGEISSYKAIVIAKYISAKYPNVEIWAYDNKPLISKLHTKYVNKCVFIPFKSTEEYIVSLAKYIGENNIDVFIPVHSDYIGIILQHKDKFGNTLNYLGRYEDYVQLHEKDRLMSIARQLNVTIPIEYKSFADAQYPFVLKPNNLSSAKGVKYIWNDKDKEGIRNINESMICQQYIQGQGCGYEVYCENGKIITEYGHLRLAEWPITGGSSVLRSGYTHPDMRVIAEKILAHIPWTGFAMFEFKLTENNRLVLIEVNPRIWGSINQALQNNIPLFQSILGTPQVGTNDNIAPLRTCLKPYIWMAMFRYALIGKINVLCDYFAHYRQTRNDINFFKDPLGVMSVFLRKII